MRVGIYAGTFDPIHAGHISFALQAMERAGLDHVYFLPERKPRDKTGVEHFGHRTAMISRALKPYSSFSLLELDDISFTVKRTLPKLQELFPETEIALLLGSDAVSGIHTWPNHELLLKQCEIIVGVRASDTVSSAKHEIDSWPLKPKVSYIFKSYAPQVSSSKVRQALRSNKKIQGSLTSVKRYSDKNWLYVALD